MEGFRKNLAEMPDAVELVALRKSKGEGAKLGECLEKIVSSDDLVSDFDKMVAFFEIAGKILPPLLDFKKMYNTDNLPFDPEKYEFKYLLGMGGESKVYHLSAKDDQLPSWILKVYRKQKGNTQELAEFGKEKGAEYERIKKLYSVIPDLVPEESMIIAEDPKTQDGMLMIVREFVGNDISDVFLDLSEKELAEILRNDPELRDKFQKFCQITFFNEKQTGEVIDLLGRNNLSLIKKDGRSKLIILDPHIFYSTRTSAEHKRSRTFQKLEYLQNIALYSRGRI